MTKVPEGPREPPDLIGRRTFLQVGGGGVAVMVAAVSGCADSEAAAEWGVILSDPALCGACSRCAITCSSLNAEGTGAAHALVGPDPSYQAHQFEDARWQAESCRMCPEVGLPNAPGSPACVAHCPTGAAQIAAPGHPVYGDSRVRFIDPERCVRCGTCVEECPFDHPLLMRDGPTRKCDLCIGRWSSPPCVAACPSSALRYYPRWRSRISRPFPWQEEDGWL